MKSKIISISFIAVLFIMLILNIFKAPDEFSVSERRRLAQFPEMKLSTVLNGKFMEGFDNFAVDQAVFREPFRQVKAFINLNILRKLDNNNIFIADGMVFKQDYPLNERSVLHLCGIINAVHLRYLGEASNVWYTIVPDKNAYLENSKYLVLDYGKMEALIRQSLSEGMPYLSIFDDLSLESYFRTDIHWRQEMLLPVSGTLAAEMGVEINNKPFSEEHFDAFFGAYYGQSALNIEPDSLVWLVSDTTKNAIITNIEKPGQQFPMYDLSQLGAVDPYSIFMCGPTAIVTAVNPDNVSGRKLIMFRDSFASALAPLLLDAYSEITLVDLRYINPDVLGDVLDFSGADILFIYSGGLFNTSDSVRGVSEDFISPFGARSRIK